MSGKFLEVKFRHVKMESDVPVWWVTVAERVFEYKHAVANVIKMSTE